jgi:pSer/pThr/pTyr-binding forkhead associated (FHA) protein/tetratricopeptide (TPR) repeat protein
MLKLHIQDDEGKTTVVPFTGEDIIIGRENDSTIQLTERNVSRRHARVFKDSQLVYVEDIASSYGTRVNGIRIAQATELKVSDVVQIGDYRIQYRTELGEYRNRNRGGDTAIVDLSALQATPGKQGIPSNKHALLHATARGLDNEFHITESPIIIGQAPDSDWQIEHPSLSHHHAEIRYENGQFVLADLGTAAGIRVNGEPYQQVLLTPGDEISIGRLKIQFLMGVNSSSDPSVWETAVMDVVPSAGARSNRGKSMLIFAAIAVVAAVGLSVLYFAKYAGGPQVPTIANESNSTGGNEAKGGSNVAESEPASSVPEEAQIDYIAKAKDHWKNGSKSAARAALDRAEKDPGDAEEALLLRKSFQIDEKMDLLYQMTADGQYETVLDELAQLNLKADSPLYESLDKRYQALRAAAEEGALDTLYERGMTTIRKGKARDAKRILTMMRAIDPENENAEKLERKIKSKARGESTSSTSSRRKPVEEKPTVRTKPTPRVKPKPKPKPKPKVAASGGPDDWYKEARKARYSNTKRAVSLLKKVVSSRPGHFRAHKLLGMIYQSQGNNTMAIKHIKKALTIRSDPGLQQFLERLQ